LTLDSSESEQRAAAELERSLKVNPNFAWAWNDLGLLHAARAERLSRRGQDAEAELATAEKMLTRAIEADVDYHIAYSNLARVYTLIAKDKLERGQLPSATLAQALDISARALQVNPNSFLTFRNLAAVHALSASVDTSMGQNAEAALDRAENTLSHALATNPNDAETYRILAEIAAERARFLLLQERDPSDAIEKGQAAIGKSLTLREKDTDSLLLEGRLFALQAAHEAAVSRAASREPSRAPSRVPSRLIDQARAAYSRAQSLSPKDGLVYLAMAELSAMVLQWQDGHKRAAARALSEANAALTAALSFRPTSAAALALRGKLNILSAKNASGSYQRGLLLQQGTQSLKLALDRNPLLAHEYGALFQEASKQLAGLGDWKGKSAAGAFTLVDGRAPKKPPKSGGTT
jgi:serine/threonine-protein kinase